MTHDTEPRPVDASLVAKLRAAGCIIMGKTHMPIDGVLPPTRNPWNLGHTAGGTSSGSGAAVGARMVPLALGEQTAGSNLRPAAYCGVEALKPTYGRISRYGLTAFSSSFDTVGTFSHTLEDTARALEIMAGFAIAGPQGWWPVQPETREAIAVRDTMLFVPARSELVTLLRRMGRPKDLRRAAALEEREPG